MTSNSSVTPERVFVWVWLPGETQPVVAGVLTMSGTRTFFTYGQSYLGRESALPLYLPELPIGRGPIEPLAGLTVAGCISDAAPDNWGQKVVLRKRFGRITRDADHDSLHLFDYLIESGSNRVGALDFQSSPDHYEPREVAASLDELRTAAERLEDGLEFSPELDEVLLLGSSLGGARPKAQLEDNGKQLIAKFSSKFDTFPVVKAEGVAMELARRVGIDAANTEVIESVGHDVLLVERFDRTPVSGERKMFVSALTILELDEMFGRYATYHGLADVIRKRFTEPKQTLREVFKRIVFNISVGNTDDHARNHGAFWHPHKSNRGELTLSPAYDIEPRNRSGGEASQAMAIGRDGFRMSQLKGTIDRAETYLLDPPEARAIVDHQLELIRTEWEDAADCARLTETERSLLWGRSILNPYTLEGL